LNSNALSSLAGGATGAGFDICPFFTNRTTLDLSGGSGIFFPFFDIANAPLL
jgi:hypothetical protein